MSDVDANDGDEALSIDPTVNRRDFVRVIVGASLARHLPRIHGNSIEPDHFVPAEKNLSKAWLETLRARGTPKIHEGTDLARIGMPIGGIGAGQLYLRGDGTLGSWKIHGEVTNSGYGATNYRQKPVDPPIDCVFELVYSNGAVMHRRNLAAGGFENVRFRGTYPIGEVRYMDAAVPLAVTLEAFSPFVPTVAEDSSLPVTIFSYTVVNRSDAPAKATIDVRFENPVAIRSSRELPVRPTTRVVENSGRCALVHAAEIPDLSTGDARPVIVFDDFERDTFAPWTASGDALGDGPAPGTLEGQQRVGGFAGKKLVNTFLGGDQSTGKLVSKGFRIERHWINFLIGGGAHAKETAMRLLVDGRVVRTASGRNSERLEWRCFDVREFAGKEARLEIVDEHRGAWGHINVDRIEFADVPNIGNTRGLESLEDLGTCVLERFGKASPEARPDDAAQGRLRGEAFTLEPGAKREFVFVLAWHFPNHAKGRHYAARFADASAVAEHVFRNLDRLSAATRSWRDTYYETTLPYWLLDRLHSTVSTLATGTCEWWKDGRFWAWEGVGCCEGTCTHVWNYAQAPARLFPELERNVRENQDLGVALHDDGLVGFRGHKNGAYAADGQMGTILKCLREHLCSEDRTFLDRNWPKIKRVLLYALARDGDADGVQDGMQHNTYDIEFYGHNTFVGALYLAALAAGERMALECGDSDFAAFLASRRKRGEKAAEQLWNGEYFTQDVDLAVHPKFQYGKGCLADQLFGQFWAHQLGSGYLYPEDRVRRAMKSIWTYNWAPDVAPQNRAHPPERPFADAGEAGLFICTWPKSEHLDQGVRYRDEVWTGIEYQVAAHMIREGLVDEGLSIVRAIEERYDASKRNPWNEIECGDHYARAMASWAVYLELGGFAIDGPKGHLEFAPVLSPAEARFAFTGPAGFGLYSQSSTSSTFTASIEVRHGRLRLERLIVNPAFESPPKSTKAIARGAEIETMQERDGRRLISRFSEPLVLQAGESLVVEFTA